MMQWQASWTQAMTDVRTMTASFNNVTLRMQVTTSIGGDHLRLELSNRFGDTPLVIAHAAVTANAQTVMLNTITIPAGESQYTSPIAINIAPGDEIEIDLYIKESTAFTTSNVFGCPLQLSSPGNFAGQQDFPVIQTHHDIPLSAPFLRSLEVAGDPANIVVVCLGDSITVGGWPEMTAAILEKGVALANRGIAGNRLLTDADASNASMGAAGLSRFDEDVLTTTGATHVVISLGSNDLGLAAQDDIPSAEQLITGYKQLIVRAQQADLGVIIATITPFLPAEGFSDIHEQIRTTVNNWIRTISHVDFDAAVRSETHPAQLDEAYDWGDHLHPNDIGQIQLAGAMANKISSL